MREFDIQLWGQVGTDEDPCNEVTCHQQFTGHIADARRIAVGWFKE